MNISGIYQIQSKLKPGNIYIGSSVNIQHRWTEHLSNLKKNKHHSRKLQRHFNKYGLEDLQFSVLLGCDKEDLLKIEQYFLDSYDPYFNTCKIAGNLIGCIPWNKGKKGVQKGWNKGLKMSDEFRQKVRDTHQGERPWARGKKRSEEARKNMSNAHKGKPSGKKGKKTSDETKEKMRESKRRLYASGYINNRKGKKL
jgi:group I intron endonuclease